MKISISKEFLKDIIDQISDRERHAETERYILDVLRGILYDSANEQAVEADAQKPCPYCYRSGRAKYNFCYNCGLDLRPA